MAISETLVQLVDIRDDIRQALIDKGIDMTNIPLSQYPEKIASISTGDFPGYKIQTGELCSLPALTTGLCAPRSLAIREGCIPLSVTLFGEFKANSGKGETPQLILEVYDNLGKRYYYAGRNGSGWVSSGGSEQYPNIVLSPMGAYNGDLETASTINTIYIYAHNSQTNLMSDYYYPKMSVTMWLEKTK